jgi:flagellar hook-associated protein 3 FlgL
MNRIGDAGQSYLLQQQMLRIQERSMDTQRQVATGYKSETYAGLGVDAGALLGSQSLLARTETQLGVTNALKPRLAFADAALNTAATTAQNLRQELVKALSTNNGAAIMQQTDAAFSQFRAALNQQFDGEFIFSGGQTGTAPVAVESVADLVALPAMTDAFANGTLQSEVAVEDGTTLTFGAFASDLGVDVLQAIRDIAEFDAGVDGPFGGELTANQRAFLESAIGTLSTGFFEVNSAISANGSAQARLDEISNRHEASVNMLTTFIGDIQDADMAEAISRLNQDQVALEAAYKIVGELGQRSLLDFL